MPAIQSTPGLSSATTSAPTFDSAKVAVIYVLGGPGAGKGTQSENLVRDYGFVHLSAGDLLRAEQEKPNSQFGELIKEYIREGKIVPMEITVKLLENAMLASMNGHASTKGGRFLIDGFPRKLDQAVFFEKSVCPSRFTLFFECPPEVLEKRLLERGKTSGRSDDNKESIAKRFKTFVETSMPVVDMFEKEGKVVRIQAISGVDEVYQDVQQKLKEKGLHPLKN